MGASPQLLASLNQTLFTQGSLCGWQSGAYRCSSLNCGPTTFIICNETGAIIEVWLGSVELNGSLPTDALPSLAELNLSFNNRCGSLPATLPASLQQIYLQSNALTAIDPAWRPGARLKDLRIYDNQLNQSLADQQGWLTSAQGLEELRLEGNSLHGSIPAGLALPPHLAMLWLSDNRLSGSLPPITLPDSLQELRLNENNLAGSLPAKWTLPASLTVLNTSSNDFRGIPPSLKLPNRLQELHMSNNSLSGAIPAGWLPSNLRTLRLNGNRLSLPSEVNGAGVLPLPPSLWTLDLSDNPLSIPLPLNLSGWDDIGSLYIERCNLSGTLPDAPLPPSLDALSLAGNSLSGTIPFESWDLEGYMSSLNLSSNRLTGRLPEDLSANVQELDLSSNELSGTLPADFPLSASRTIDLSLNRFTGTLPPWKPAYSTDRAIVLPQRGTTLCGQLPPIRVDKTTNKSAPIFYRKDPAGGNPIPLQPGDLPPCP